MQLIVDRKDGDYMSIGQRITELRKAQNLSQGQLARALEVSRQAVSKWENDTSSPDSLKLIKLADLLDTDIEYLTTGRRTYARRPPVVLETVKTVEKVVEKPVVQLVEKIVEVEKPVVEYVEKPVIKKVVRVKHQRNAAELVIIGIGCFALGLLVGILL